MIGEIIEVNKAQAAYYQQHSGNQKIMAMSLADFIGLKLTGEKMKDSERANVHSEIRNLRQTLKLPEATYWGTVFRAQALEAQRAQAELRKEPTDKEMKEVWGKVEAMVLEKTP
jgi:hypothetical protein